MVLGTDLQDSEEDFEQVAVLCSPARIPSNGRSFLQSFPGAWSGREARGNDLRRPHPGGHVQRKRSLQSTTAAEAGLNLEVARTETSYSGRKDAV